MLEFVAELFVLLGHDTLTAGKSTVIYRILRYRCMLADLILVESLGGPEFVFRDSRGDRLHQHEVGEGGTVLW